MKTLIIHPEDDTTKFLTGIYANLSNKTVITGGINKSELKKYIDDSERVIMLGHGSPMGLLSVNRFSDCNSYIIDYSMVESLRNKNNIVFIWCNADQFVHRHSLQGFYSGMFISEDSEAWNYDFWDVDQDCINESNNLFLAIVSNHINERLDILFKNVKDEYGAIAKNNLIAEFNLKRLSLTMSKLDLSPRKVGKTL